MEKLVRAKPDLLYTQVGLCPILVAMSRRTKESGVAAVHCNSRLKAAAIIRAHNPFPYRRPCAKHDFLYIKSQRSRYQKHMKSGERG